MVELHDIPNIIKWIRSGWRVSEKSLLEVASCLILSEFKKRELLVWEGGARGMAYFIEEGMTRSYWAVDGEEITTSFSSEGSLVFSMDELYYRKLSEEYVEAVEAVRAYGIALDSLRDITSRNLEIANWFRVIHQDEYRRLHRSHKERLTLPAKERYLAFAEQFPEVCRRARLSDIASYLGITPATLSRLRAGKN